MPCRYRICSFRYSDEGGEGLDISVREAAQLVLYWIRGGGVASRRGQETQELQENAHGLLCLLWAGASQHFRRAVQRRQGICFPSSSG